MPTRALAQATQGMANEQHRRTHGCQVAKKPPPPRSKIWYEGRTHTGGYSAATKHVHNKREHKKNKRYARCPHARKYEQ